MRAGAVQLNSTEDTDRNLATAERLVREAAARGRGARRAAREVERARHCASRWQPAPSRSTGAAITWARAVARELGIDLVAGSIVERVEGTGKSSNTSVHVGPDGELRGVYRKIHMFDVEVDGVAYAESEHEQPGDDVVVSELADGARARDDHLLRRALPGAVPARWRCAARR